MDIVYSGGKFKFSFNFEFEWELLPGLPLDNGQDDWHDFMDDSGYMTGFGNHQKPSYDGYEFNIGLETPSYDNHKYTEVSTSTTTSTTSTTSTTTSTTTTTTTSCPPREPSPGDECNIPPAPNAECPWGPGTSGNFFFTNEN